MNKKILGVFVSILSVTMLIVPISAVLAKNPEPETVTLEGVYLLFAWLNEPRQFDAGESGHYQWKARDLPVAWDLGDIVAGTIDPGGNPMLCSPGGYYNGNWVTFNQDTEDEVMSTEGITILEDAIINGVIGTGDLKIFTKDGTIRIISGTGAFKGIKGIGTYQVDPIMGLVFYYTLEVQFP